MLRRARFVLLVVLVALVAADGSPSSANPVNPVPALPGPGSPPGAPAPSSVPPATAPGTASGIAVDPARLGEQALVAESEALDRAVARQELRVEAAAQAHDDMLVDVARLHARLGDVRARHGELRRQAAERAVALYVDPRDDLLEHLLASADLDEGVRRRALVASLQARSHSLGDELRRAERDLRELEASTEASEVELGAARHDLAAQAAGLAPLQERKVRVSSALRQRIEALTAEADGHAATQAAILRVIAQEAVPPPVGGAPPAPVTQVVWPADGEVTSEFGMRWGVLHRGIDIAGPEGTPVVAARAGRVIEAGWTGGYGLTVIVDHGDGSTSLYAHLSAVDVGEGDQLGVGAPLGAVGSTGNSTGPHLHFETRVEGEARDPRSVLP